MSELRTARGGVAARMLTEVFSPTLYGPALLIALAVHDLGTHGPSVFAWAAVAALFVGAIPIVFLRLGVRRGRWDDHHVTQRRDRAQPFLVAAASATTGSGCLLLGGAPRDIAACVVAMLAGVVTMLVINHWVKISVHTGTCAGALVVLASTFGISGAAVGALILVGAGWSRVATGDHTRLQVAAGGLIGLLVAATVYLPLR